MPLEVPHSAIPLWSGRQGSLFLDVQGDPGRLLTPGDAPVINATFHVEGNNGIAIAARGAARIGIKAGSRARIIPLFLEDHGAGADLAVRYSLTDSLRSDNLLLVFELGADGDLTAKSSFHYSVLSAETTLQAGADTAFIVVRCFPRSTPLEQMLRELFGGLTLPGAITAPPAAGDLVSFEYGGRLGIGLGASAGYQIRGTHSCKVNELSLSEHYALSIIGKLSLTGRLSGRFSIDVTAGTEPGFARVVVRRRRQKELQFAVGVDVEARLKTDGLPAGREFLGALVGLEARNWLNLVDQIAGQPIDTLKTNVDGLTKDFLSAFAGNAMDLLAGEEIEHLRKRLDTVTGSYRTLHQRTIALFERFLDRTDVLEAKLERLSSLLSFDQLDEESDSLLWSIFRQLTDGDPLTWTLGTVPESETGSLLELRKRAEDVLALSRSDTHQEIRRFINTAKKEFSLDSLLDQLAAIPSQEALRLLAHEKLGHFVQRLIGKPLEDLGGDALQQAYEIATDVAQSRDKFFTTFDKILKEASAQSFTLGLHTAYNSATESHALLDMELKLCEAGGTPNSLGRQFMEAAGRGDFEQVLARYDPAVVRLRHGLLTHTASRGTAVSFNVAGWHRSFHYEAMHRLITNTEQQIRSSGTGLLTVFTTVDMRAESAKRRRGKYAEEAVLTNFLLRFLGESKLSDSAFDTNDRQYVIDVITGMAASYDVTFSDSDTTDAELDGYLALAKQLGLDRAGATRAGLAPVLEETNGSFGATSSTYEVRYTKEALERLLDFPIRDTDIRQILRRIVFANYFRHPQLREAGWLYASDQVRALYNSNPAGFVAAESILGNATVNLVSPLPGISRASNRFENTPMVRHAVATLFRMEVNIVRAFSELAALLHSTQNIRTRDLEKKLQTFGKVLQEFDSMDMGENSIFAVFDGLILLATSDARARASSLTFISSKDGARHTKVFTHLAASA